ncbi:2-carboxy-1,4-naphthoquinone phytyltransferase [Gloeocapsa sp. PCC 73106]|uniref:2-carboxy-1,4-naphthoquinone phytyltransferase n=1 Tax=Gloeocapsa sp. PCC 73106 TaxID=102232 RepID=UPI0002ABD109|nr:2-carboxy-1,4-naphthoquinone phytyltransferase [Gloeocapsa sp. PCC 73106]ELR98775.1 1,4-dihydroxy-2-naphthoate phytyltransferase [Gloeocapsa sp. PCC 73106]
MTTQLLKRNLWLAAIKPPMYTVAVIPIIVGTAVAFAQTQQFTGRIFFIFLTAAIAIIAWLNLSNDVFDSETGIDQNKAHSVVNLTGNKVLVFWLSNAFLALGILGIILITWWLRNGTVLALVLLSCALGYTYQGPPFRLGYQGLGELICFICFGPIAIAAVEYSQIQNFSLAGLAASVIIGLTTSVILFCSHFHQVEDDQRALKRSPVVRLGTAKSAQVLTWAVISIFLLILLFIGLGIFPIWTLITVVSFPLAYRLVAHVKQYHDQPKLVSNSKFLAVNFHFVSGLLLALGFILEVFL